MNPEFQDMVNWLRATADRYLELLDDEVIARQQLILLGDFTKESRDVLIGLLARQRELSGELARTPGAWTDTLGPLILRPIFEVLINLTWILLDPAARATLFIEYGLGQLKLELEHRRSAFGPTDAYSQALEHALSQHQYPSLTVVNVGAWSSLDMRSMAQECGMEDTYRLDFAPLSGAVHSQWQWIAPRILRPCNNPLHGGHMVRSESGPDWTLEYWLVAADCMSRTLGVIDEATGGRGEGETAAETFLLAAIEELGNNGSDEDGTESEG